MTEDRFGALKFTIPYPPSLNVYWRNFRGRMVLSAEAKKYKRAVRDLFESDPNLITTAASKKRFVGLKIDVYRPRKSGDLDNTLKAILDSLNENLYEDDRQVIEIHAMRHDDKDNPRVEIGVRYVLETT
jgi:crossover junction endodeoxyribonuclease RusA